MRTDFQAGAVQRDNLLGVCAAIAEVTGLPALAIRLAVVAAMFAISFPVVVAAYAVAAIAIFLADLPARAPRAASRQG